MGTITAAGVYTAPALVPAPPTVSVQAVSAADSVEDRYRAGLDLASSATSSAGGGASGGGGGGGGVIDPLTLLAETLALGVALRRASSPI